jgi:hypothetical protein
MPPRKTKIVDVNTIDSSGSVAMTVFGWCSTGHHVDCRVEFTGNKCSCDCHLTNSAQVDESPSVDVESKDE